MASHPDAQQNCLKRILSSVSASPDQLMQLIPDFFSKGLLLNMLKDGQANAVGLSNSAHSAKIQMCTKLFPNIIIMIIR